MDCKVITVYISEEGNFPYKKYNINVMLWEEERKITDGKKNNEVKIYIDTRYNSYDYITANKHNLILRGEYTEDIKDSNQLREFIKINKPYYINSIARYEGRLAHLVIGAK